ncbi:peptidoglycan-binding protein [Streptomyces sp. NPDC093223]|uniref:peptidoglycan-binding protein n=1 Tax=Streptomyces sp. NPDC093223 TaxID=3366033 RepID=UPI003820F041
MTVAIAGVALAAIGGGVVYVWPGPSGDRSGAQSHEQLPPGTEPVVRGDLVSQVIVPGSVEYSGSRTVANHLTGVITWMPSVNTEVQMGRRLYAVDNQPVILMHGALPAWREFKNGMSDGEDVRMLEESLAELGYTGFTVDDEFSEKTEAAIKRWQKNTGLPQTGKVELGRVVFSPSPLRIAALQAHAGEPATDGQEVLQASGSQQRIASQVPQENQNLAVKGAAVQVELPDGTRTDGVIVSVGVLKTVQGDKKVVPVIVHLDSQRAVKNLQNADVAVILKRTEARDVLSVPVTALLPDSGGGFSVQIVRDGSVRRVAVRTGAFANGRAEVSGPGVAEGVRVGVPKL